MREFPRFLSSCSSPEARRREVLSPAVSGCVLRPRGLTPTISRQCRQGPDRRRLDQAPVRKRRGVDARAPPCEFRVFETCVSGSGLSERGSRAMALSVYEGAPDSRQSRATGSTRLEDPTQPRLALGGRPLDDCHPQTPNDSPSFVSSFLVLVRKLSSYYRHLPCKDSRQQRNRLRGSPSLPALVGGAGYPSGRRRAMTWAIPQGEQ